MEKKINVAELLKDCPQGMELYSPLCGKCVFDRLNYGTIICKKQNKQEITFTSEGFYMLPVFDNCECMIFPSKDQRDWSKFQRPFKEGDIVTTKTTAATWISIYKEYRDDFCYTYADLSEDIGRFYSTEDALTNRRIIVLQRLATGEEKEKLFDAIKENGYTWNPETKTLEKLDEAKFKVGDNIRAKGGSNTYVVTEIRENRYILDNKDIYLLFKNQNSWELVTDKFDITTLKPFDKVLARDTNASMWIATLFSHLRETKFYTVSSWYNQCIPFVGNEHLLGTADDCDEFYKTWK